MSLRTGAEAGSRSGSKLTGANSGSDSGTSNLLLSKTRRQEAPLASQQQRFSPKLRMCHLIMCVCQGHDMLSEQQKQALTSEKSGTSDVVSEQTSVTERM